MSWTSGLAFICYSLVGFPTAGLAWGLMWVTDRLYEGGWWWFMAIPLRIIIFLMQGGVLLGCLGTVIGILILLYVSFNGALHNKDLEDTKLSLKGYTLFLVLPVVMFTASLLIEFFQIWLNFNEHGLGLIFFGYMILDYVLQIGSLVVILVWLVILPIFLRRRKTISITE